MYDSLGVYEPSLIAHHHECAFLDCAALLTSLLASRQGLVKHESVQAGMQTVQRAAMILSLNNHERALMTQTIMYASCFLGRSLITKQF